MRQVRIQVVVVYVDDMTGFNPCSGRGNGSFWSMIALILALYSVILALLAGSHISSGVMCCTIVLETRADSMGYFEPSA